MRKKLLLCLLVLWLWVVPMPSQAQDGPAPTATPIISDNEVNRVAKNLYCPVCENLPLDVCPTDACIRWREEVRALLAQGYSQAQVESYFATRFGPSAVGRPTSNSGFVLNVGVPYVLAGLGGLFMVLMLWRWQRGKGKIAPSIEPPPASPADRYHDQLEDDLRKRY
jgi:cytochrome c-type biogenesis protein CcmH